MSASPATSSTRAAASANWSGHRPLSAIAAAAGGGVPQARIRRVLQDLLEPLARLHAQGQVHGAIAMSTIGLDTSGKAHLLVPPLEPAPDAEGTLRIGGYAAFEQYTDDPEHPCGPWTDVYALSAVAHTMVVGAPPPAALARCVKDTYVPLAGRELGGYDADFLRAVDQGLSMNQQARPQSMEALAAAFGVAVARPEAPEAPAAAAAAEPAPPPALPPPRSAPGPRVPLLVMLGVLAAVALAAYLWLRPGMQPPVQQAARDTAPPPAVEEPVPTPPALSDLNNRPAPADNTAPAPSPETVPDGPAAPATVPAPAPAPEQPPAVAVPAPEGAAPPPADAAAAPPGELPGTAGQLPASPDQPATPTAPPDAADPAADAPAGALPGAVPGQPGPAGAADSTEPTDPAGQAAPAADAPKPPEPAPPASGEIRIHVQPWGEVLVDGRPRGISPPLNRLTLSPGRHQITIRNPAASDYHTTVNVPSGGSASVSHVFE